MEFDDNSTSITKEDIMDLLESIKSGLLKIKRPVLIFLYVLSIFLGIKWIWAFCNLKNIGSFESEKTDILARRDYLHGKLVTDPEKILASMPAALGTQFQGEWALYSCSMYSAALVNIAKIYPETREESLPLIDSLISAAMSSQMRSYDSLRWGEDPLETLDGDTSHISYISHLAWMISGYKAIGGGPKYDRLYHRLCSTMNRRLLASGNLNLETYPEEYIYVPDNLVAYVALSNYSHQYGGRYWSTVYRWLEMMGKECVDRETGLIPSLMSDSVNHNYLPLRGSYSALNCYYLTFIDEDFARDQYEKLKAHFLQKHPVAGIREYYRRRCLLGMDIDAGPIIMNLSPSGTAFGIGPATFFHDDDTRKRFLRTAEIAGSTVSRKGSRHYLLANVALVGESIALATRTAVPWY